MTTTPHPAQQTTTVRILRDTKSQDGWIGRTSKGKVCFIYNLDDKVEQIQPGQTWKATIALHKPTYIGVHLTKQVS